MIYHVTSYYLMALPRALRQAPIRRNKNTHLFKPDIS